MRGNKWTLGIDYDHGREQTSLEQASQARYLTVGVQISVIQFRVT
jgi:hypothetical protein